MRKHFEVISVNPKTPQQLDTVAGQDVVAILEELGIKYTVT